MAVSASGLDSVTVPTRLDGRERTARFPFAPNHARMEVTVPLPKSASAPRVGSEICATPEDVTPSVRTANARATRGAASVILDGRERPAIGQSARKTARTAASAWALIRVDALTDGKEISATNFLELLPQEILLLLAARRHSLPI